MRRLFLGLALVPLTCRKPARAAADLTGSVDVTWAGAVTGKFTAPGDASWCGTDSLLEVMAVRHDTGVAFTVLVQDVIRTAQYPVISATVQANWRPLGYAALRVATDTSLRGYEATSGVIHVTTLVDSAISGTLDLRLKRTDGPDTAKLRGTFTKLRIARARGQCGRLSKVAPGTPPAPVKARPK